METNCAHWAYQEMETKLVLIEHNRNMGTKFLLTERIKMETKTYTHSRTLRSTRIFRTYNKSHWNNEKFSNNINVYLQNETDRYWKKIVYSGYNSFILWIETQKIISRRIDTFCTLMREFKREMQIFYYAVILFNLQS